MSRAELIAVLPIIVIRTAQIGGPACVLQLVCYLVLPAGWTRILVLLVIGLYITLALHLYFTAIFSPRTTYGYPLLTHLPSGFDTVALTFDDGPHPDTTPIILDSLARYDATATFFLIAEQAECYPDLVRRIAAEGHTIGIHGLRHEAMVLHNAKRIKNDLLEASRIIEGILGESLSPRLFRPPHGFKSLTLCRTVHRLGWHIVAWSLDSRDYDPLSAEEIAGRIRAAIQVGDIVLLHERPGHSETIDALPLILEEIQRRRLKCIGWTG